jgi:SAM-dependent methyltransferase
LTEEKKAHVFAHERLLSKPIPIHTEYDLRKRLRIVFEHLLPSSLTGSLILDAGTGRGFFAAEATRRGAQVVAVDIALGLVCQAMTRCGCLGVVADISQLPFMAKTFDIVICSEVIEHLEKPERAICEISRVIKAHGTLALTTPNRLWLPTLRLVERVGIRRVSGLENWLSVWELRRSLEMAGFVTTSISGFNLFPFLWPRLFGLVDVLDRVGSKLPHFSINVAIAAHKLEDLST